MNTDTVRLNITIPKELARTLDKFAGSRKRSRFIAEAVKKQRKVIGRLQRKVQL